MRNVLLGKFEQIDFAAKPRRPGIRTCLSCDYIHHGCLTGAVWTDNAEQFTGIDIERQVVQGLEAVEADSQLLEIESFVTHAHFFFQMPGAGR